jgi:hypothetical protein
MHATWGIGTTLEAPTDLTDRFAVANDRATIRKGLLPEALAKHQRTHGYHHENGLMHGSSHPNLPLQTSRYYLSALEMQRPSMICVDWEIEIVIAARRQAETPLIVLFRFLRPALFPSKGLQSPSRPTLTSFFQKNRLTSWPIAATSERVAVHKGLAGSACTWVTE